MRECSEGAMGLFGGVWDYNKMGWVARKTMGGLEEKMEAAGFKEVKPGFYDTRAWKEIRSWAKQLAEKACA